MNKKRAVIILLVLVAGYFLFREFDGYFKKWYADRFWERETVHVASAEPDQVCLTWSGDPASTISVQWRTDVTVGDGWVEYRLEEADESQQVQAVKAVLSDALLVNDPTVHRFTATVSGLTPGTAYRYRVGQGEAWSEWHAFTTAPAEVQPFHFMYLGDPQEGLDEWGELVKASYDRNPQAAFYIVAGDLVDNGRWREQWDDYFFGGAGVFDRVAMMPCLGNHDYDKQEPELYLEQLVLPENGPGTVGPERAYSFSYSNALFVVLDSMQPPSAQTQWLDETLERSTATWKFVMYHHPAYPSKEHRDNPEVLEEWVPVFDRHHVDIAFQGHDHAYLRTYPMHANERVDSPAEGTVYLVTVSGSKFYEQEDRGYGEVMFAETATYQTIDIATGPDRLTYRAFDVAGDVRDEFVIEK